MDAAHPHISSFLIGICLQTFACDVCCFSRLQVARNNPAINQATLTASGTTATFSVYSVKVAGANAGDIIEFTATYASSPSVTVPVTLSKTLTTYQFPNTFRNIRSLRFKEKNNKVGIQVDDLEMSNS